MALEAYVSPKASPCRILGDLHGFNINCSGLFEAVALHEVKIKCYLADFALAFGRCILQRIKDADLTHVLVPPIIGCCFDMKAQLLWQGSFQRIPSEFLLKLFPAQLAGFVIWNKIHQKLYPPTPHVSVVLDPKRCTRYWSEAMFSKSGRESVR